MFSTNGVFQENIFCKWIYREEISTIKHKQNLLISLKEYLHELYGKQIRTIYKKHSYENTCNGLSDILSLSWNLLVSKYCIF